jgi:hypothetical protein
LSIKNPIKNQQEKEKFTMYKKLLMVTTSLVLAALTMLSQGRSTHAQEKARTHKRVVPMRVYLDAQGAVHCAIGSPDLERLMLAMDGEIAADSVKLHTEAARNAFRGGWLPAGVRVHLKGFDDVMPPHAAVHLRVALGDEIMWYSDEGLDFTVSIRRNPMLVLVTQPGPADSVQINADTGADNPFTNPFPLRSGAGEAVYSGAFRQDAQSQKYFMYEIRSSRATNIADPDVIGD